MRTNAAQALATAVGTTATLYAWPARLEREAGRPLGTRVEGTVIAHTAHARVVETIDERADHGRLWSVQTSLMSEPNHEASWSTVEALRSCDGRIKPRGRKVYPHLVRLPADAINEATGVMRNASQYLSVLCPLLVEARELLLRDRGNPKFASLSALLHRARAEEQELAREVSAGWDARRAKSLSYGYVPEALVSRVLHVLLSPQVVELPLTGDGVIFNAFAPFDWSKLSAAARPAKPRRTHLRQVTS